MLTLERVCSVSPLVAILLPKMKERNFRESGDLYMAGNAFRKTWWRFPTFRYDQSNACTNNHPLPLHYRNVVSLVVLILCPPGVASQGVSSCDVHNSQLFIDHTLSHIRKKCIFKTCQFLEQRLMYF